MMTDQQQFEIMLHKLERIAVSLEHLSVALHSINERLDRLVVVDRSGEDWLRVQPRS